MKLVLVSGMSGAGKSIALHALEDCNFYCMDNLPIGFLSGLLDQHGEEKGLIAADKIAIGIGVTGLRSSADELRKAVTSLKESEADVDILFLDASDATLLKRYNETRRLHPMSIDQEPLPIEECIAKERLLLDEIASIADSFIDTSHLTPSQLNAKITQTLCQDLGPINLTIQSFGYKRGLPNNSDYVFDVRCLPNPYWHSDLRSLSGDHRDVITFIENSPQSKETAESIYDFLKKSLVHFHPESRKYITVSVGCTGGFHRSVYVANKIYELLRKEPSLSQWNINQQHRDL